MKKTISIIISIYLFIMFLVYSGIFRDHADPLQVTRYYFEILRNREYFLMNRITKPESANDKNSYERGGSIYKDKQINYPTIDNEDTLEKKYQKFRFYLIKEIKLILLDINDRKAYVQAKIIHKDKRVNYAIVELEKTEKKWLLKSVKYKN